MNTLSKILIGVIFCLIGICIYFGFQYNNCNPIEIVKTDTLWINKTDTIIEFDTIYRYINRKDTVLVYSTDSVLVEVPIEIENFNYQKTINDKDGSSIKFEVLGNGPAIGTLRPTIDSVKVDYKLPIVTIMIEEPKKWTDNFNFAVQLGFGYGFFNKKPDLFIGAGIGYEF